MKTHTTFRLSALLFAALISFHAGATQIQVSEEMAFPGQVVTVTVTIDELPDRTTSIQGSLVWNEDLITLMDANVGALSDMNFNTDDSDRLGFLWYDANGRELAGVNELIRLTFMATEDIDSTDERAMISFGDEPTNLEVAGANFEPVPLEAIDGFIDILDGLPVELAAFDATATNNAIALAWATESEVDFEGFEVQRSVDGSTFSTIAWLDARGSETQGASYGYTDNDATSNKTYYYRLQMWDFDGTFEYSNVVSARIGGRDFVINVYPNPTYQEAVLEFERFAEIDAYVLITVNDNMGRPVQQLNYMAQTGKNIINLNVNHLSAGMYTVRLEQGEYFAMRKLIVR